MFCENFLNLNFSGEKFKSFFFQEFVQKYIISFSSGNSGLRANLKADVAQFSWPNNEAARNSSTGKQQMKTRG